MGALANPKSYMMEYTVRRAKTILKNSDQKGLTLPNNQDLLYSSSSLSCMLSTKQGQVDQWTKTVSLETGPLVYENMIYDRALKVW